MKLRFAKFVLSLTALMMVFVGSLPSVQAYPAEDYRHNSSKIPPGYAAVDADQQQRLANDPQYYISLRWLVYMLILSLPIAPAQPPAPDQISIFVPQIQPPQTTLPKRTDL